MDLHITILQITDPGCCAGMSNSLAQTLNISNYVFTGLFAVEMILKLFALGFFEYIADRFNCFDGVVVILSVIEIILDVSMPILLAVHSPFNIHFPTMLLDITLVSRCLLNFLRHYCDESCIFSKLKPRSLNDANVQHG